MDRKFHTAGVSVSIMGVGGDLRISDSDARASVFSLRKDKHIEVNFSEKSAGPPRHQISFGPYISICGNVFTAWRLLRFSNAVQYLRQTLRDERFQIHFINSSSW